MVRLFGSKKISMKTEKKIYIRTFGCQMNEYDSSRILALLAPYGYVPASGVEDADLIIFNTCTVRQKAEDKAYSEIGRIKKLKNRRQNLILGVGGCIAQQEGETLIRKYPFIDFVFGTKAMSRIAGILEKISQGAKVVDTADSPAQTVYIPPCPTVSSISAFLTIMQGCDNYCSYCIVPYVRGREWSRTPEEILSEARHLAASGVKEITLLGQNVNSYGKNLCPALSFPDLIGMLNRIDGIDRIRFTTSHPKDLSPALMDAFIQYDKLCAHIHLPLQSGSDRILHAMNRNYTGSEYIEKAAVLREKIPDIGITTDIIVGFPGETEQDFEETLRVVRQVGFDDIFMFHYTDRKHTKASKMAGRIAYREKIERLTRLKTVQKEISIERNSRMVGKTVEILFDRNSRRGSDRLAGKTGSNKLVNCSNVPKQYLGTLKQVRVEKANIHSLTGTLV